MSTTAEPTFPTLNQVLTQEGYTTAPAPGQYEKYILKKGKVVFQGDANAVWEWLRDKQEERQERAEAKRYCRAENGWRDA